jgi:alpha-galactosidase
MGDALEKSGRPIVYSLCEYGWGDVWKWGAKSGGNLGGLQEISQTTRRR